MEALYTAPVFQEQPDPILWDGSYTGTATIGPATTETATIDPTTTGTATIVTTTTGTATIGRHFIQEKKRLIGQVSINQTSCT